VYLLCREYFYFIIINIIIIIHALYNVHKFSNDTESEALAVTRCHLFYLCYVFRHAEWNIDLPDVPGILFNVGSESGTLGRCKLLS